MRAHDTHETLIRAHVRTLYSPLAAEIARHTTLVLACGGQRRPHQRSTDGANVVCCYADYMMVSGGTRPIGYMRGGPSSRNRYAPRRSEAEREAYVECLQMRGRFESRWLLYLHVFRLMFHDYVTERL